MQPDAAIAYNQSYFKGTPAFLRLPRHRWPAHFREVDDPVCPIEFSLYGHPESGHHLEEHSDKALKELGFDPVEERPGYYWCRELQAFLIVYVDDFKASAPSCYMGTILTRLTAKMIDYRHS